MCGIGGFLSREPLAEGPALLEAMSVALRHRGPDAGGWGEWRLGDLHVGLASRRLKIIDLSDAANQPLGTEDGTVQIVYNGEIYNHRALGEALRGRGHLLRTHSDTEVIAHLYEEEGSACLDRLNGMFALAIWDGRTGDLFLARDRLGIKPLYYYDDGTLFAFASELRALLALPALADDLNELAICHYLMLRYVPAPHTIFRRVRKLPPGHALLLRQGGPPEVRPYWDVRFAPEDPHLPEAAWRDRLRDGLRESVRSHLVSDVPVGVFLSGGLDSSLVTALMREAGADAIPTFTVRCSGDPRWDEGPYAARAAAHLGTRHVAVDLDARAFFALLPEVAWALDEPLADPAAIPLYRVARAAREHGVVVLLSGEGSDELLAGYSYHRLVRRWRRRRLWGLLEAPALAWLNERLLRSDRVRTAQVMATVLRVRTASLAATEYERRRLQPSPHRAFPSPLLEMAALQARMAGASPLAQMLYVDLKTWLPEDLLMKADKTTMASGVELRVPFLDHTFVELACQIPSDLQHRGGEPKYLLKRVAEAYLPRDLIYRPKMGFPVPVAAWLREPQGADALAVLREPDSLVAAWADRRRTAWLMDQHRAGRLDYSQSLWTLLVLEHWARRWAEARRAARWATAAALSP